jgi:hypothetical protein
MSPVAALDLNNAPLSQELEDLFREHSRLVYRTAYSVTGSAHDAEDVVQALFLQLLRRGYGLRRVQYDAGFTTIPGEYTIKFLARNAETGRIGTYQADFVVPNLNLEMQRLPISTVVLSGQRVAMSEALFNAGKTKDDRAQIANPLIEDGLKLIPSVTRVFSRSRDLYVYVQAYERDATTTQPLAAFVTFNRGTSRAFQLPARVIADGLDARSKAVPIKLTVPLSDLEPGEYTCQITILDTMAQKAAFWQSSILVVH